MTRKFVISFLLFCGFAVLGFYVRKFTIPWGIGDSGFYRAMAENPGTFIRSPWGYRIAVPYAAAAISEILSLPLKTAFGILQLSMFGVILTLIFRWVSTALTRSAFVGAISVTLFALSYPGVYNLHNIMHVGLGEHLFVLLGCMAIYSNRFVLLCLVTVASCLVKESVGFLLIPTYFVSAMLFSGWRTALLRTACLASAFIAPFWLLRSGILFQNHTDFNTYTALFTWDELLNVWNYYGGLKGAIPVIVKHFAPLFLISLSGFLVAPPRLKALAVLPVLAALQIVFAVDILRMVGVGVPVLIALSSFALSRMKHEHAALVCSLVGFTFLCYNHKVGGLESLKVAFFLILVLLWMNRSTLLVPVIPSGMMTALTKRFTRTAGPRERGPAAGER